MSNRANRAGRSEPDDVELREGIPPVARPSRQEIATDTWDAEPAAPAGPRPLTGDVMMKLRALLVERTKEPWHAVARLRPLTEEPDGPFEVYAKSPGGSQWVGKYDVTIADADLALVADDVIALRSEAGPPEAPAVEVGPDGEVVANTALVGQRRKISLANGNVIEVTAQRRAPAESEQDERSRLDREIAAAPKILLMAERDDVVGWNGIMWPIRSGANLVPQVIADKYLEAKLGEQAARWRMSQVLREDYAQAYIDAERRGY